MIFVETQWSAICLNMSNVKGDETKRWVQGGPDAGRNTSPSDKLLINGSWQDFRVYVAVDEVQAKPTLRHSTAGVLPSTNWNVSF